MSQSTPIIIHPELNEWQIQELKAAIKEADKGDFASPEEAAAVFNKWGINAGDSFF